MKIICKITLIIAASLFLSACSNQQAAKDKLTTSEEGVPTAKSRGYLSASHLSPKQTVAVITVYAAKKYKNNWQDTLNDAKRSGINVSSYERNNSDDYRGSGYIYEVNRDETCYTTNGDGTSQIIYLYDNDKLLGQQTVEQIVEYLNRHSSDKVVKDLAARVTIDGDSDSASGNDNADSFKENSDLPADAGIFTVPSQMVGTWYNDKKTIKFGYHSYEDQDNKYYLHKQTKVPDDPNGKLIDQTKDYMSASVKTIAGFKGIVIANWVQSSDERTIFVAHKEMGQAILLEVSSSSGLKRIYWQSEQLAKKYANKKFTDLINLLDDN